MGRTSFLHALQVLVPRFQLYGTFVPNNANAGGSAICIQKDLLLDDAMVTHVVTCQGRDHTVNMRSGCRNLVVVNVHLEPELTPQMGFYARCPGLVEHLSISPWLKHATSIATLMFLRTLENGPYRVTMQPYAWFFKKKKNDDSGAPGQTYSGSGSPNVPFSSQF